MKRTYLLWSLPRQPHDKYQREENIAQTVVITTYCNEHKAPSGTRFFKTHREDKQIDSYSLGIRISLNEQLPVHNTVMKQRMEVSLAPTSITGMESTGEEKFGFCNVLRAKRPNS